MQTYSLAFDASSSTWTRTSFAGVADATMGSALDVGTVFGVFGTPAVDDGLGVAEKYDSAGINPQTKSTILVAADAVVISKILHSK